MSFMSTVETSRYREGIRLLAQGEVLIAQLYNLYSELFPETWKIWAQFAEEERQHARIFRQIVPLIEDGLVAPGRSNFHAANVRSTIDFVQSLVFDMAMTEITVLHALEMAISIENTLTEQFSSEILTAASVEAQRLIKNINQDEWRHRQQLQDMLRQEERKL